MKIKLRKIKQINIDKISGSKEDFSQAIATS